MKRLPLLIGSILFLLVLTGCGRTDTNPQIAATTLPVYEFTAQLCHGTDITVTRLITEDVSCLHDYTLQVKQMRIIEGSQVIVTSGAGLEDFLEDAIRSAHALIDASEGISLHCGHTHDHQDSHHHESDPHIWLSPKNAKHMAQNICNGLIQQYPQHEMLFLANLELLEAELDDLSDYADIQLSQLSSRELITFHDGFSYMAEAFDLTIVHAIEEESGSEASAAELIQLIQIVESHRLQAIFTERSGSTSAASVVSAETGAKLFVLDMAMSGSSYFEAMYHNIDILKEALE